MLTNGYRKYFSHKTTKCRHGWTLCDHFLCYFARSFSDELSNLQPAYVQSSRISRGILGNKLCKSLIKSPANRRLTYKRRKLLNTRRFVMFRFMKLFPGKRGKCHFRALKRPPDPSVARAFGAPWTFSTVRTSRKMHATPLQSPLRIRKFA